MIVVVADTSPIRYLVIIEAIAVLPQLYDRVVLPSAVVAELTHANAPASVKEWAGILPEWIEVKTASHVGLSGLLDPGEAEAIALAEELKADSLLLDETEAREEALRRGLQVSGTIGVLERAAERGLIVLTHAFQRLSQTNFRIAPEVLRNALERDSQRRAFKARDHPI
jgi:predicted nucleic acid-binding protein